MGGANCFYVLDTEGGGGVWEGLFGNLGSKSFVH